MNQESMAGGNKWEIWKGDKFQYQNLVAGNRMGGNLERQDVREIQQLLHQRYENTI